MRIRKNAKISSILLSSSMESVSEILQTHVCQLNQSPWDVIPFSQHTQLEPDDSFTGNASLGDSIGAVESVASMMEGSIKLSNNKVITNENNEGMEDGGGEFENGNGFDKLVGGDNDNDEDDDDNDEGWNCTGQPKGEFSLFSSNQGRSFVRSSDIDNADAVGESNYYSSTTTAQVLNFDNRPIITKKSAPIPVAGTAAPRRTRPSRSSKKAAAAANPYEFYYYSGFGPSWGKKRRDRGGGGDELESGKLMGNVNGIQSNTTTPSSSQIDIDDEFDYVDDDEEEEEEEDGGGGGSSGGGGGGDSGKKRTRKPVKARSLKSLM